MQKPTGSKCNVCEKIFDSLEELKDHEKKHESDIVEYRHRHNGNTENWLSLPLGW